jgi:putative NADH-flavin reductase
MTLAVLGASGRTGRALLRAAGQAGLQVRALCRGSSKVEETSHVHVLRGDPTNTEEVEGALAGAQVVCCLFGPRPPYTDVFCAAATRTVIEAMQRLGPKRLICQTGAMIGPDAPNWSAGVWLMAHLFRRQRPAVAEDRTQQELIARASALDWTLVKPPRLTDGPATGRVRAGADLRVGLLSKISRPDLATFVVSECLAPRFVRQAVYVME